MNEFTGVIHRKSFKNRLHVLLEVITWHLDAGRTSKTIFKKINSHEIENIQMSEDLTQRWEFSINGGQG